MVKRDFIAGIVLASLFFISLILLRLFVFSTYKVSEGEASTFLPHETTVLVSNVNQPDYKDFVVYKVDGKKYLGRVVAKPGDNVVYMDDIFYLNHKIEDDSYLADFRLTYQAGEPDRPYTEDFSLVNVTDSDEDRIPAKTYLILNDNRQNTQDSREFGLIGHKQIEGVVTFKILPFDQFGFVTNE